MKSRPLQEALLLIPRAVQALPFVVAKLPEFIVHGGISVDTSFEYKSPTEAQPRTFFFRTVIQMDADIINFLPGPDFYPDDDHWNKLYQEYYRTHRIRVEQLFAHLDGIPSLAWLCSTILSLGSTTLAAKTLIGEMETLFSRLSFVSLLIFLTCVFRKYLFRYLLKLSLLLGGYLIKNRIKNRDPSRILRA